MSCQLCSNSAEIFCTCAGIYICSKHITQHLSSPGTHNCESINIALPETKLKSLKAEVYNRQESIDKAKSDILRITKDLVNELCKYCKEAINKLDFLAHKHEILANSIFFSSSLIKEVERVIDSKLKIRDFNPDIKETVLKSYRNSITSKLWEIIESSDSVSLPNFISSDFGICIICNKNSTLFRQNCEHPRCSDCEKKTCSICEMQLDSPKTLPNELNSPIDTSNYLIYPSLYYNSVRLENSYSKANEESANMKGSKHLAGNEKVPNLKNKSSYDESINLEYASNLTPTKVEDFNIRHVPEPQVFNHRNIVVNYTQNKGPPNRKNNRK